MIPYSESIAIVPLTVKVPLMINCASLSAAQTSAPGSTSSCCGSTTSSTSLGMISLDDDGNSNVVPALICVLLRMVAVP